MELLYRYPEYDGLLAVNWEVKDVPFDETRWNHL